ncbi:hypothetical protein OIDMADRAFT_141623 [Oidiodendron maius Zn]|uniref:Uncharacterized protein n=1 Tax=Oidiodendron maius (strain Zn) TaxID=913774 RepID=A0A0C3D3V9_OIDMZ|nr:hypothetical protein OIDMADRAFT_141623 [Oidiodendron maius Zn]
MGVLSPPRRTPHHSPNFLSSSHHHPENPLSCTPVHTGAHSEPAKSSKRIILCHPASLPPLNSISAFRLYLPSPRSVISPFRPQRHACMVVPGFSDPPPETKRKRKRNKTAHGGHMGIVTRGEIPFRHLLFAGQLKLYVENKIKGPIYVYVKRGGGQDD